MTFSMSFIKIVSQGKASTIVYLLIALKVICWFYFLFCTAKAKSDSSRRADVVLYIPWSSHIFPFLFHSLFSIALPPGTKWYVHDS